MNQRKRQRTAYLLRVVEFWGNRARELARIRHNWKMIQAGYVGDLPYWNSSLPGGGRYGVYTGLDRIMATKTDLPILTTGDEPSIGPVPSSESC